MHTILESIARRLATELNGLDRDAVEAHPGGNAARWSRKQIIEHLALSYGATSQILDERLAKRRVSHHQHRTRLQWALQTMVLGFGYLPTGAPALEETIPDPASQKMDGEDLTNLLLRELESMDRALQGCRRRFGMERVAPHPILGPLRVDQWIRYHSVHSRHHIKQLAQMAQEEAGAVSVERVRAIPLVKELQVPAQRSLS